MNSDDIWVRGVSFGEAVIPEIRIGMVPIEQKVEERAEKSIYTTRRVQMYWRAHELLTPTVGKDGRTIAQFAIPAEADFLRKELAPIPKGYDDKGRPRLPPKRRSAVRKRVWNGNAFVEEKSLEELIGCSPDHADAMVLAIFAMETEGAQGPIVGAF